MATLDNIAREAEPKEILLVGLKLLILTPNLSHLAFNSSGFTNLVKCKFDAFETFALQKIVPKVLTSTHFLEVLFHSLLFLNHFFNTIENRFV